MGTASEESLMTWAVRISMSPSIKSGDRFDGQRLDDLDDRLGLVLVLEGGMKVLHR